jgi:hypothetical protein
MNTIATASPQVSEVSGSGYAPTSPPAPEDWSAGDLARYIREQITLKNGPQLPVQQESEIIKGFYDRYGAAGVKIAWHVFNNCGGMWKGAPVTVRRFALGQDEYFAATIFREINV